MINCVFGRRVCSNIAQLDSVANMKFIKQQLGQLFRSQWDINYMKAIEKLCLVGCVTPDKFDKLYMYKGSKLTYLKAILIATTLYAIAIRQAYFIFFVSDVTELKNGHFLLYHLGVSGKTIAFIFGYNCLITATMTLDICSWNVLKGRHHSFDYLAPLITQPDVDTWGLNMVLREKFKVMVKVGYKLLCYAVVSVACLVFVMYFYPLLKCLIDVDNVTDGVVFAVHFVVNVATATSMALIAFSICVIYYLSVAQLLLKYKRINAFAESTLKCITLPAYKRQLDLNCLIATIITEHNQLLTQFYHVNYLVRTFVFNIVHLFVPFTAVLIFIVAFIEFDVWFMKYVISAIVVQESGATWLLLQEAAHVHSRVSCLTSDVHAFMTYLLAGSGELSPS